MKLSRFRRPSPASLGSVLVTLALAVMTPLAAGGALPASAAGPVLPNQYNSYHPAQPWNDMTGNPIQAHGGQVVASTEKNGERVWYWYGEDRTNGYGDTPGVHVYSSHDLYNWKDRGLALRSLSSQDQLRTDRYFAKLYRGYSPAQQEMVWRDLSTKTTRTDGWGAPSILERPKVAYNKATGKWVMWVHSDGPTSPTSTSTYERAQAGIAISDSPFGPFRWIGAYRLDHVPSDSVKWCGSSPAFDPAGGMARDMNLFVDDDGTAYIVYSSEENRSIYISKLNRSYTYLSAPPETAVQGKDFVRTLACTQREAPAMFKAAGTYYLITSGATGWSPNPARYATAKQMLGEWTDKGNPVSGPGASTTFSSQSTAVIPYDSAGNKFVFMADRWTPADLANAPYVWLPMRFGEGGSLLGTLSDGRTFTRSVAVAPHHLQYVVNAGGAATRDWTRIADAGRAEGAMLNSSPEQPLGADPTTGKTWGFTGASGTVGDSSGDVYNTLRWAKNHESLVYTFTGLNPGKYSVYAGYYDPWPWANRAASVSVNGEIVDPQRLFTSDYKAGTYTGNVVGPDGTLAVQVSPTRSPDIQLSWLMVAADE